MTAAIIALHDAPTPAELEAELAQLSARIDAVSPLTPIRVISCARA